MSVWRLLLKKIWKRRKQCKFCLLQRFSKALISTQTEPHCPHTLSSAEVRWGVMYIRWTKWVQAQKLRGLADACTQFSQRSLCGGEAHICHSLSSPTPTTGSLGPSKRRHHGGRVCDAQSFAAIFFAHSQGILLQGESKRRFSDIFFEKRSCLFSSLRADVSKNQTLAGNSQKIDFAHTFKFDTLSC